VVLSGPATEGSGAPTPHDARSELAVNALLDALV